MENAAVIDHACDELDLVTEGRRENQSAGPRLQRAQDDHGPVDEGAEAFETLDQVQRESVGRAWRHSEGPCQAGIAQGLHSVPDPVAGVARMVGIVEEDEVELVDLTPLQRFLGGHPQVGGVVGRHPQTGLGEARESLRAIAPCRVEIMSDATHEAVTLARHPGQRLS